MVGNKWCRVRHGDQDLTVQTKTFLCEGPCKLAPLQVILLDVLLPSSPLRLVDRDQISALLIDGIMCNACAHGREPNPTIATRTGGFSCARHTPTRTKVTTAEGNHGEHNIQTLSILDTPKRSQASYPRRDSMGPLLQVSRHQSAQALR